MSFQLDRVYYGGNGQPIESDREACAKTVTKTIPAGALGAEQVITKYFVKYAGFLYDPHNMNEVEVRYKSWVMKEVSKKVFDIYLDFLKTKHEHFRINAERLINVS